MKTVIYRGPTAKGDPTRIHRTREGLRLRVNAAVPVEDDVAERLSKLDGHKFDIRDEVVDATTDAVELAEANGIDLASIDGTGKDGRIVVNDVKTAISAATDTP